MPRGRSRTWTHFSDVWHKPSCLIGGLHSTAFQTAKSAFLLKCRPDRDGYDMRKSPSFNRILSIWSLWPIWCALVLSVGGAFAQSAGPQPLPMPAPDCRAEGRSVPRHDPLERRRHRSSSGTSSTFTKRFRCARGEPIVLLYPQWLPGYHSPAGRVDTLAGLMIYANGARVEWTARSGGRVRVPRWRARGRHDARRQFPVRLAGRCQRKAAW